jgi:putative metalloprotease
MRSLFLILVSLLLLPAGGCEDTDLRLATEAGLEAVSAVTLSDEAVSELSARSAEYADGRQTVAPPGSPYALRLRRLVADLRQQDEYTFNYKVYLDDRVNAFAMGDGSIRIYSGLMDLLDDGELRFVIGHEMGHVVKEHVRRKMQLAYAASAIRKGVASQNSVLGDIARSTLGGFMELLLNAQFSQLEEKAADDYGLAFLRQEGYDPDDAVSALQGLAALGNDHSFLSSHPQPGERAQRLVLQLQGKAPPIEDVQQDIFGRIRAFCSTWLDLILEWTSSLLSGPSSG